jgi:membrane protein
MTWLWISAIVVLLGAELDAHDTTTGAPTPLATRGAKMADTVGAARKGA